MFGTLAMFLTKGCFEKRILKLERCDNKRINGGKTKDSHTTVMTI